MRTVFVSVGCDQLADGSRQHLEIADSYFEIVAGCHTHWECYHSRNLSVPSFNELLRFLENAPSTRLRHWDNVAGINYRLYPIHP